MAPLWQPLPSTVSCPAKSARNLQVSQEMPGTQGQLCSLAARTGPTLTSRGKTGIRATGYMAQEVWGKGEGQPPNYYTKSSQDPCLPGHDLWGPHQRRGAGVDLPGLIRSSLQPNSALGLYILLV